MKAYAHTSKRNGCDWKTKKLSTKHDVYHPVRSGHCAPDPDLHDPTAGAHSRPSAKRTVRNAKRAQKKRARQWLKRDLEKS